MSHTASAVKSERPRTCYLLVQEMLGHSASSGETNGLIFPTYCSWRRRRPDWVPLPSIHDRRILPQKVGDGLVVR